MSASCERVLCLHFENVKTAYLLLIFGWYSRFRKDQQMQIMKLVDHVVRSFKVAKVFHDNKDRINSIDFTTDGNTLISSSDDESINLYDCQKGL